MKNKFIQTQKGKKAEEIVERACKELFSENKIAGFKRYDVSGRDFILFFTGQKPLEIEVKSSYDGELFHNIKHPTRVLVVPLKKEKISKRKTKKLVKSVKNQIVDMGIPDGIFHRASS